MMLMWITSAFRHRLMFPECVHSIFPSKGKRFNNLFELWVGWGKEEAEAENSL